MFDPLAHHILCIERKNRSIPFRDLMTYQKWVIAQTPAFLAELVAKHRPQEPKSVSSAAIDRFIAQHFNPATAARFFD